MSLKISRYYNKFRVTFVGMRYKIDVDDLDQVSTVQKHYFEPGRHNKRKCPVCKEKGRK